MAEVASVAGDPAVQGVDVGLGAKGAGAFLTHDGRIAAVAVGTGGPGAKGNGTLCVDSGAVVVGRPMAEGAVAAVLVAGGATNQAEVRGAMAIIAVVFMGGNDQVGGARGVMAGGAGGSRGHIAFGLVIGLDVAGVIGGSI